MLTVAKRELNVFLHGQKAGVLTGNSTQIQAFKYDSDYSGSKLSHSMPTARRNVSRQTALNWFENLLPEGQELRRAMASAHDSRDTSTLGLLEIDGLDCAGAVQLTADEALPERVGGMSILSDEEIGERLMAASSNRPVSEDTERWSVAGQQGKIALHQTQAGEWARSENGLPTTHILKPGIPALAEAALQDQALIEHVTLAAARNQELSVTESSFTVFDGTPAIVVKRYDRYWSEGECLRIHQEDMCQSLGVSPDKKYEERGGPGVASIAALLESSAPDAVTSQMNRFRFAQMVIFNYLSGSSDAHAKNYSMLIAESGDAVFAPMYDAASGLAFSKRDGKLMFPRAAMKIGNRDHFGRCTEADWRQFATDVRLPYDMIEYIRDSMAPNMVASFFFAIQDPQVPEDARDRLLKSPMLDRMDKICAHALGQAIPPDVIDLGHVS